LTSLDHAIVAVPDLDAATDAWSRLLGRSPSWRGTHPALGTENALFRLSKSYLELLAPVGAGGLAELVRARIDGEGEGVLGVAFGTLDADACADALRRRGLPADAPVDGLGRDAATGAERRWRNVHLPVSHTRGVLLFAIEHRSPPDALPLVAPTGAPAAAVGALDHVVIASPDPDAAATLYGDKLGLRLALDRTFEARGLRILFFRVGGVTIEVVGRLGAPGGGAVDRATGLAFRTDDVAAARARVAAAGFDVSEVRPGQKPGTRVCTVRGATNGVGTLLLGPDPEAADRATPR
jgi:catechol 2,3-dioxygenase-like lactoylglutathione lyase family enzyme